MNKERGQYTVTILDEKITILSDETAFFVEQLALNVEKNLKEVMQKSPTIDAKRAAFLVALRGMSTLNVLDKKIENINVRAAILIQGMDKLLINR